MLFQSTARLLDHGFEKTDLQLLVQFVPSEAEKCLDRAEEAARHYDLFGRNVLPFASSYLEATGQLGGIVSDFCLSTYSDSGFAADLSAASPDHFSVIFDFLAHLSRVEAAGDPNAAGIARSEGRAFVNHFLLAAFHPFMRAVGRHRDTRYAAVLSGVWEVLLDYAGHSDDSATERWGVRDLLFESGLEHEAPPTALPADDDLDIDLDDPNAKIRHIAAYLTNCARCGLYLSQTDMANLGAAHDIPRGFGSRTDTLENLMHSAIALEGLEELLGELRSLIQEERDTLRTLVAGLSATALSGPHPSFSLDHLSTRLDATRRVVDRIATEAAQASVDRD